MNTRPQRPGNERGFTLVELMIALTLGLVLTGGIITLFVQNQQSFRVDESVARMHDEARYAMQELARDLRMASFFGNAIDLSRVEIDWDSLADAPSCGPGGDGDWFYRLHESGQRATLRIVDNATPGATHSAFSCIAAADVAGGSDVVAIKRVAGRPVEPANRVNGMVYLRSNTVTGMDATLYRMPEDVVTEPPYSDWEYRPRIYFVRPWATAPGDGIPTLCRRTLVSTPALAMETDCIAHGVEGLQVEFGIAEGMQHTVTRYVSAPTAAESANIVSARISLLMRTAEIDGRHTDTRTYRLGNAPDYTPADGFHRRVFSTSVPVHNMRTQLIPDGLPANL